MLVPPVLFTPVALVVLLLVSLDLLFQIFLLPLSFVYEGLGFLDPLLLHPVEVSVSFIVGLVLVVLALVQDLAVSQIPLMVSLLFVLLCLSQIVLILGGFVQFADKLLLLFSLCSLGNAILLLSVLDSLVLSIVETPFELVLELLAVVDILHVLVIHEVL